MLGRASIRERDIDSIVVAADLSIVDNISALKAVSARLTRVAKRICGMNGKLEKPLVEAFREVALSR